MPQLNPNKGLVQLPLRHNVTIASTLPADWLTQLGKLIADDILKLSAGQKADFLHHLKRHAGDDSTYSLKAPLHESLKVLYTVLSDATTALDQKQAIALKLVEGAPNCSPGFHDRTNECVISLSIPQSLDELLSIYRQGIVSRAANATTDEIHAYNRFFVMAQGMGYGVRPLNPNDIYQGNIADNTIKEKIEQAFAVYYTFFPILNSLHEQINGLVRLRGYNGRRDAGYQYEDYHKFDDTFLKPFISMTADKLFVTELDENFVPVILDINWLEVKKVILDIMIKEKYFLLSAEEITLLDTLTSDNQSLMALTPASMSLIQTTDDLVCCLTFFSELSLEKKAELVSCYLKDKLEHDQKAILDKLANLTGLGAALQSAPALQKIYLRFAANEGNLDKVKALMAKGADVNAVLGILIAKQKAAAIHDPIIRAAINANGMNAIVSEGQHQGKTVAEVWVNAKRGRYWLAEDTQLQSLFPDMVGGKSKSTWLQQAQAEKPVQSVKLFTPVNPLVIQFLQHIAYGEQAQAEAMLQSHANMAPILLTTAGKVKDYSGRTIKGTGLQLAIGAEDVKYHDNEECMTEMLMRHLKLSNGEDEIATQISNQFPDGWEESEKERAKRDLAELNKVVDAIAVSRTNGDCEVALQAFRDYLERENKGKGVIKTGKHFNIELLVEAFKVYEQKYTNFGGWDSRKSNVFWRNVIGYTQRFLPACYAQAFCQGPCNIVDDGEKLNRSMKFSYYNATYYPLDSSRAVRLGYNFTARLGDGSYSWKTVWASVFTNYVKQKTSTVRRLTPGASGNDRTKNRCIVM